MQTKEAILKKLNLTPQTTAQIAKKVGGSYAHVSRSLAALVASRKVKRVSHGVYQAKA